MKKLKVTLLLVLAVGLLIVVLQNTAPMQVHFLWLRGEMSAVLLLFLTAAAGFIAGLLATLLVKGAGKPKPY